jgi:hypothetical protein
VRAGRSNRPKIYGVSHGMDRLPQSINTKNVLLVNNIVHQLGPFLLVHSPSSFNYSDFYGKDASGRALISCSRFRTFRIFFVRNSNKTASPRKWRKRRVSQSKAHQLGLGTLGNCKPCLPTFIHRQKNLFLNKSIFCSPVVSSQWTIVRKDSEPNVLEGKNSVQNRNGVSVEPSFLLKPANTLMDFNVAQVARPEKHWKSIFFCFQPVE